MINFFYTTVYQPLFNFLIFLHETIPFGGLGLSVIVLTILIKLILYPLGKKAIKSQKELQLLQPEVKKIQEKYKKNKEEQAKKIMDLYREKGINPFSGIIPLFVQIPILIVLFQIFIRGFEEEQMKHLYSFVHAPEVVNYVFLGIIDLSSPNYFLAIIAGLGQFLHMKISMPSGDKKQEGVMGNIQKQMIFVLPGVTFFILLSLPSVVGVYWIVTVIFSILQHYLVIKNEQ